MAGRSIGLYEKSDLLGGNLFPAGTHDFKENLTSFVVDRKIDADKISHIQNLFVNGQVPVKF